MARLSAGADSLQCAGTPPELLRVIDAEFGLVADLAANEFNQVRHRALIENVNGGAFDANWATFIGDGFGWLNPEFGDLYRWTQKARREAEQGARIVMLTPVGLGTRWFADNIYQGPCSVRFLFGRVKFCGYEHVSNHDTMITIFDGLPWRSPLSGQAKDLWDWRTELAALPDGVGVGYPPGICPDHSPIPSLQLNLFEEANV